MNRVEMIRDKLTSALAPESLEIIDRSHEHAGHEGAKSGGGHFDVIIVAEAFAAWVPYNDTGQSMKHSVMQ